MITVPGKSRGACCVAGYVEGAGNMHHRYVKILKRSFFAICLVGLPLAGCSTANLGTFGNGPAQIADISDKGSYTADGALQEARGHFRNNDFGYSAAFYKKVAELSPQNPEGYIGLGASYDRLGRFDLSDRVYVSLHKITGDTAQYYNNVGYSHMLRGNLPGALTNFRKAEKLDPENVVVANNIQLLADAAAGRA